MSKTVSQLLNEFKEQHNRDVPDVQIESIVSVVPLPSSLLHGGTNEMFVQLILRVDDIYKVGHLAIDWIEDAESKKRISDAIPPEKKAALLLHVPMAQGMIPQIVRHAATHKEEYNPAIQMPYGTFGAYEIGSLKEYVPEEKEGHECGEKRWKRVQCYNTIFYREKTEETNEICCFMWRTPRLSVAKAPEKKE